MPTPYVEPTGDGRAGWRGDDGRIYAKRLPTAWEEFLKEEGLPVYKGIGVYDSRELPRANWPRVGGKGSYIQLIGTNNQSGMFVVEVPPRSALKPQRHMYEERYVVIEGNGTTEVWKEGGGAKTAFDWQQWSLFSVPLNANFRIINDSSAPAILIGINMAPRIMNEFNSRAFIFENSFNFDDRFGGNLEDYWTPRMEVEPQPVRGRAMVTTNLIPDASQIYLPLDNNRGPGHRWIAPNMAGNHMLQGWIAQYPSGRYAKAHHHGAGAVLICLGGKGYSITWPKEVGGMRPWEDGKAEAVQMQEYVPGGMISAAPGLASWFHQHFAFGKDPFRVFLCNGPNPGATGGGGGEGDAQAEEGSMTVQGSLTDITQGGNAIPYFMEDPYVRKFFEQKLKEEGAAFDMPVDAYTEAGANLRVMED